ncbi:NAD-dependent epimerase/dehydratase family protein [Streptomyces sp. NBC_00481]|nr:MULTISPECIES: NAD-dependent epimerase/dehydratase family protein [unclassified Streptomyces]WRY94017.1 NAD-dependent epimerase/dehydratase family protein [Streptomyces sp. NBC_00481]
MADRRIILVTGATGTTGRRVVSRLTAPGHPVTVRGRRPAV